MNTQETYNKIKQEMSADWMPELKQEPLAVHSVELNSEQAWSEIHAFQATQGWVQTLDQVSDVTKVSQTKDTILTAEMINAQGQSLHLRPANRGQLIATLYSPDGDDYFYTETSHQIKLGKTKGTATYRLYWSQNAKGLEQENTPNTQAQFSRIMGFDLKEKR